MAEIASAIVGLIAVGASIGKINDFTHSLRDAPDELRDLAEEVEQFSLTLSKLQRVNENGLLGDEDVKRICEHGRASLNEVGKLIEGLSQSDSRDGLERKIRRVQRATNEKRAKSLRDKIGWQRSSITNLIASRTL